MKMKKISSVISGTDDKPIAVDFYYNEENKRVPVCIYAHGFCGFKDWGNMALIAREFVDNGFAFSAFNFSHNGVGKNEPESFSQLNLFAENNFTKQLFDFKEVIDLHRRANEEWSAYFDPEKIVVIGHSMGGGIALLTAVENANVKAVTTWASVSVCNTPFGNWDVSKIEKWKNENVAYYHNGRTRQDLPMHYQLYEDATVNADRLNILERVNLIKIPVLICHGTLDTSVDISNASLLHSRINHSKLFLVNSDHVFGRKHPNDDDKIPDPMQKVVQRTINFFQALV